MHLNIIKDGFFKKEKIKKKWLSKMLNEQNPNLITLNHPVSIPFLYCLICLIFLKFQVDHSASLMNINKPLWVSHISAVGP